MTDEQIIKALQEHAVECCQHARDYAFGVHADVLFGALDLINRQAENIADLTDDLQCEKETVKHLCDEYCRQMRQDLLSKNYAFDKYYDETIKKAKCEAVKEFAEKVKMAFYYEFDEIIPSIMSDKIDNLVKEMTENNENSEIH